MRVAMIVEEFPVLSETFIVSQIRELLSEGVEVHLYCRRLLSSDIRHRNLHIHPLSLRCTRETFLHRLPRIISNIRWGDVRKVIQGQGLWVYEKHLRRTWFYGSPVFDAVHIQFAVLLRFYLAHSVQDVQTKNVLVSARGFDVTKRENVALLRKLVQKKDVGTYTFLPVSHSLKRALFDIGVSKDCVRVLHSGVCVDQYSFDPVLPKRGTINLLCGGRLVEKKGHLFAIRAVDVLVRRGLDVRLSIVGDGPLRDCLRSEIRDLGLEGRVRMRGGVSHARMIESMRMCDIFVLHAIEASTGDREGIPNVLKEAMALGRPVVSTRHSGITELVEEGVSGFLCEEKNVEGMADAIEAWLDCDASRGMDMLCRAREKVEREFDMRDITQELMRLYRRV